MTNKNLKTKIEKSAAKYTFKDDIDKVITCAVLYKFLLNVLSYENSSTNNSSSVIDSYMKAYRQKIEGLEGVYVSYNMMRSIVKRAKVTSFMAASYALIDEIYSAYLNKTITLPFSASTFNSAMYQLTGLPFHTMLKLSKIHNEVMAPISNYYFQKNGIATEKMQIISADGVASNIGKEIVFKIEGVKPLSIISDIEYGRINIEYLSVTLKEDTVRLLTK